MALSLEPVKDRAIRLRWARQKAIGCFAVYELIIPVRSTFEAYEVRQALLDSRQGVHSKHFWSVEDVHGKAARGGLSEMSEAFRRATDIRIFRRMSENGEEEITKWQQS